MAEFKLTLCVIVLAAGCGFSNDGAGRVRLPGVLNRCAIVVQDDLGASLPTRGGPKAPTDVNGAECDVLKW